MYKSNYNNLSKWVFDLLIHLFSQFIPVLLLLFITGWWNKSQHLYAVLQIILCNRQLHYQTSKSDLLGIFFCEHSVNEQEHCIHVLLRKLSVQQIIRFTLFFLLDMICLAILNYYSVKKNST